MASRKWFETVFGASRRRGIARPRRERDDWYIPLEVGRLEERRVLNVAPIIAAANNLANVHQNQPAATNTGTQVAALISGKVTDPDPGCALGHRGHRRQQHERHLAIHERRRHELARFRQPEQHECSIAGSRCEHLRPLFAER